MVLFIEIQTSASSGTHTMALENSVHGVAPPAVHVELAGKRGRHLGETVRIIVDMHPTVVFPGEVVTGEYQRPAGVFLFGEAVQFAAKLICVFTSFLQ